MWPRDLGWDETNIRSTQPRLEIESVLCEALVLVVGSISTHTVMPYCVVLCTD